MANWRDLFTLYRNRSKVSCFDMAIMLTRGSPLGLAALLSHVHLRNGVVTAASQADKASKPVMGQIRCVPGRRNAQLTFLYPENAYDSPALPLLLDGLAHQAGLGGSFGVLAEVDELDPVFETLRRCGYSVYGWQRVYRLPFNGHLETYPPDLWRFAGAEDELSIRQLFQALVPPLAQAADPLSPGRLFGLLHQVNGQTLAYVESNYGPDGIYLRPLIHPNVNNIQALLSNLEYRLLPLHGRKVYMTVRSHQSWLENPLMQMDAEAADRQALMVKHLSTVQRKPLPAVTRSMVEDGAAKPTARVKPSRG